VSASFGKLVENVVAGSIKQKTKKHAGFCFTFSLFFSYIFFLG